VENFYQKPQNWEAEVPTAEELANTFLNGGIPVVIRKDTIYELAAL
jgi:hypothetical protein